jgi:hypothetical protein
VRWRSCEGREAVRTTGIGIALPGVRGLGRRRRQVGAGARSGQTERGDRRAVHGPAFSGSGVARLHLGAAARPAQPRPARSAAIRRGYAESGRPAQDDPEYARTLRHESGSVPHADRLAGRALGRHVAHVLQRTGRKPDLGSGSFGYPKSITLFPPRMYGVRLGWSY